MFAARRAACPRGAPGVSMARVQLSLNVSDLDAAVDFYSRLFATRPAKLKPGYANFAISDPPLKLVLNAPGNGPAATANHLGVEVESAEQVDQATRRLQDAGVSPVPEHEARCCTRGRPRCGPVTRTARRGSFTPSWPTSTPLTASPGRQHRASPRSASELPCYQRKPQRAGRRQSHDRPSQDQRTSHHLRSGRPHHRCGQQCSDAARRAEEPTPGRRG